MKFLKKIAAALLLCAVLASALVSCGGSAVDDVVDMYKNSEPTKVVATTVHTIGDITLNGRYVITTGSISGKEAAVYEEEYQEMRDIESGGETTTVYSEIKDIHNLFYYVEGKGTKQINPKTHNVISDWSTDGKVFDINQETFTLNLRGKYLKDEKYENNTLTAIIPAQYTEVVLGYAIASDASLVITDNGAEIIGVRIEYTLPKDGNVQETKVVINIAYTYDNERITIN